jgi:hypothetical protein
MRAIIPSSRSSVVDPLTGLCGRDWYLFLNALMTNQDPPFSFGSNPNITSIGIDGHQTMGGAGRPWRDELTDAVNIKQNGSDIAADTAEGVVNFSATGNLSDYLYLNIQLNHDKDLSSQIFPHIHFFQAYNVAPNFLLQYRWQRNGQAKVTSWTSVKCNALAYTYTSGTISQIASSVGIFPPSGSGLSDIVQFRFIRDNANTSAKFTGVDTYTGAVGVMSIDIHFMINSIGSNDEYVK